MTTLTLADEIVVLMLDDEEGDIKPGCLAVAGVAIAAGALMELALQGRIDTDLESLFIVDAKPTGEKLLDDLLAEIAAEPAKQTSAWWIDQLSTRHDNLVERVLGRLVSAGILKEESRRFLWMFSRRAYPPVSGKEEREAKARLLAVLFNDEVPDPRDTLLLGLAKSTGVLAAILSDEELEKSSARVNEVAALEEIGRAVGVVTGQVRSAVASIMMAHYP
jgi:hypothetical protein